MKMMKFKQFITENPQMIDLDKNLFRHEANKIRKNILIHASTNRHNCIGDNLYHFNQDYSDIYYRRVGEKIHELSIIHNNQQKSVDKGDNGDVSHIYAMMKHHALVHGVVSSDSHNSLGSKHMWMNLVKSKPTGFHFFHYRGQSKIPITAENIDSKQHEIWGDKDKHQFDKIMMEKD